MNSAENKLSFISKFYCTVNKTLYYILSIITITPLICIATNSSPNVASALFMLSLILYAISMYVLYKSCVKYRKNIQIKEITTLRKIWFISSSMIILILSVILASGISIIISLNKFLK